MFQNKQYREALLVDKIELSKTSMKPYHSLSHHINMTNISSVQTIKLIVDLIVNVNGKFNHQCNSSILVIYLDIILANQ
jgi:hypothetical protein